MIKKLKINVVFLGLSFVVLGCSSWHPAPEIQDNSSELTATVECSEPRNLKCTREYLPVCAVFNDGTISQYANACTACSKNEVRAYQSGDCPLKKTHSELK